jgi:hypothetical protein
VTILASTIIDRVSKQLVDPTNIRWSRTQLLDWVSVGQRFIITLQPQAGAAPALAMALVAGTKQTVPIASVVSILKIVRNLGVSGTTPGRAIGPLDTDLLDRCKPSWHTDTASAIVQCAAVDKNDPDVFWVYPPSNGLNYVQVNYAANPAPLATESTALGILDMYEEPLTHYVMFRALSKNADFAATPDADKYLALFNAAIGATTTAQQANAA